MTNRVPVGGAGTVATFSAQTLRRVLLVRMVAASIVTTAGIITYYQLIGEVEPGRPRLEIVVQNIVIAAVGIVVLTAATGRWLRRRLEPEWHAVIEGRPVGEQEQVFRQPARAARFVVALWLLPAFLSPTDDIVRGHFKAGLAEFVGIFLGSLANGAVVYLVTERALRPLFRRALQSGARPSGRYPGVRQRFMVAWALGSGIPLIGIAATPVVRTSRLSAVIAMMYLASLGLAVGLVMTRAMARSVAEPLAGVVDAMGRIEGGDFDTAVDADDAGDIGRLQTGLNQMAAGLRERAVVEDLFGRHVGTDVAKAALTTGIDLTGEAREATVLFVDLVSSTAITSTVAPAAVVATANRLFGEIVRVVAECGGWVNKFQGDGAMCVFGAPVPDSRHTENGMQAAALLSLRLRAVGLDAAIGVASGVVIAGHVGTEDRLEYTVMGATVNKAARLCDLAKRREGRALAAVPTEAASHPWGSVGEVELRGFVAPVPVVGLPPPSEGVDPR